MAKSVRAASTTRLQPSFDVVDLFYDYMAKEGKYCKLNLISRAAKGDPPASVSFRPLSLRILRDAWYAAQDKSSEEYILSRFMIVHELGHIVLHEDDVCGVSAGFAGVMPFKPGFTQEIESAEWQVDVFTQKVLVPPETVRLMRDAEAIAELCSVPIRTAREVLDEFLDDERRLIIAAYGGDLCPVCNCFSRDSLKGCTTPGCKTTNVA